MQICLLRHGQAEPKGVLYPQDANRPLSQIGVEQIRAVAGALRKMGADFDLILTSPLLRTRETADIVADACGYNKEPEQDETLGGSYRPELMLRSLETIPRDCERVLLTGHAPSLDRLIAFLISTDESCRVGLAPGGLAWVEIADLPMRNGILHWVVPPEIWTL